LHRQRYLQQRSLQRNGVADPVRWKRVHGRSLRSEVGVHPSEFRARNEVRVLRSVRRHGHVQLGLRRVHGLQWRQMHAYPGLRSSLSSAEPDRPVTSRLTLTRNNPPPTVLFMASARTFALFAIAGGKPVLLRVDHEAGHGIGSNRSWAE